jgi:hypothetical protein
LAMSRRGRLADGEVVFAVRGEMYWSIYLGDVARRTGGMICSCVEGWLARAVVSSARRRMARG